MKLLLDTKKTPPNGWRYVDPDTGFKFRKRYNSLEELVEHVQNYRDHNGFAKIPKLTFVIQDWLCSQPNMEKFCQEVSVKDRSLSQYLRGAKAAAKVFLGGDKAFVSEEEAEARASLCAKCRHNKRNSSDSKLRHYTDEYVQDIVGDRKTSVDAKLFSCEICSCALRPKVHISQEIVEDSLSVNERRALEMGIWDVYGKLFDCWQVKRALVTYKGGSDGKV